MKWEYCAQRVSRVIEDAEVEVVLQEFNRLGEMGWELVSSVQTFAEHHAPSKSVASGILSVFKRPRA